MRMPDAIAPYASLIKWALIGIILSSVFIGGCQHGKNKSAEKLAKKDALIVAITNSLNGATKVFKSIEQEADRRIAQDKKSKADAKKAGDVADAELKEAKKRIAAFEYRLQQSKRKPACKALLEMNVEDVCAL